MTFTKRTLQHQENRFSQLVLYLMRSFVFFLATYTFCSFLQSDAVHYELIGHSEMESSRNLQVKSENSDHFRILHIVTSLAEYNNGSRNTINGQDRMVEVMLPVLKKSVESFLSVPNWEVDVYLILGFKLRPERKQLIVDMLPDGVGLEVWDNACPIGYPRGEEKVTQIATHGLARQHRFVVKDKLDVYDFFSAWEDDMVITSQHVENYLEMLSNINQLKQNSSSTPNTHPVYGSLHQNQLDLLIPGFIRVEVLNKDSVNLLRRNQHAILPDPNLKTAIDPNPCCELHMESNEIDDTLSHNNVILWETEIKALGVRQLPGSISWVALLPGGNIPSYWSGADGAYNNESRPGRDGKYMAQQAGFMATKSQIQYFDSICPGGFLPPFDHKFWNGQSGLKPQNVEFWSGGYQLFARCGLQRIISLDSQKFSRQLLFHYSNNKQRQISPDRFVKASDLFRQLHTVRSASQKTHKHDINMS